MTARLVAWLVIAVTGPQVNRKDGSDTDGAGRVVRPLDVLVRFAEIAGQEARKEQSLHSFVSTNCRDGMARRTRTSRAVAKE
jgi:hypothetical protein